MKGRWIGLWTKALAAMRALGEDSCLASLSCLQEPWQPHSVREL